MNDIISTLSDREKQIVLECLFAAEQEEFFPEWEFETLFGMTRSQLAGVRKNWPKVDTTQPDVGAAIVSSMNHLLGYPHAQDGRWEKYISVQSDAVQSIMDKLIALGL
jgi:hypothetical protein